ncbi:MAG: hypothetical protein ACK56F_30300, partial [bacterium]
SKPTETIEAEAEKFKEQWQNLAGIGAPKSAHNTELLKELADKWSKAGFPESDPSLPMGATKITTIDTNFGSDNDPLASVPMSRVSKGAKQKMAEIAKADIIEQLEQNTDKFTSIFPESVEYTDEYSKPDYSKLPNEIKKAMVEAPVVRKPKRKSNPKQMDGILIEEPFVKSRKKATKKTK